MVKGWKGQSKRHSIVAKKNRKRISVKQLDKETNRLISKRIANQTISPMPNQFTIDKIREQARLNLKKKFGDERFGIEFNSGTSNIWSNISGLQKIKTKEKAKKEIFKLRKKSKVKERFRIVKR